MKIPFALPNTEKIEVDYVSGNVKYKKIMPNPKDNGLLAMALWKEKRVEMKNVLDVRSFIPLVRVN